MSAALLSARPPEGLDAVIWSLLDTPLAASGSDERKTDSGGKEDANKSLRLMEQLVEPPAARRLAELSLQHVLVREIAREEAAQREARASRPVRASKRGKAVAGPSDEALVEQAEAGVPGAFDVLMERYLHAVVAVAYSLLSDIESARDVAQDTFMEAVRTLSLLRERAKFGSWVYGIARRKAIYVLRRRKMHYHAIQRKKDEERAAPATGDPAAPLDRRERAEAIRSALNQLPEIYREILVLKYMDERSYGEIASLLGISLAAVDKRLMRGKAMLRESLRRWITG